MSKINKLDEIREILKVAPSKSKKSKEAASKHNSELTKPIGSLGKLEDIAIWLLS